MRHRFAWVGSLRSLSHQRAAARCLRSRQNFLSGFLTAEGSKNAAGVIRAGVPGMALEPDPDPPPTVASLHDDTPPVDAPSGDAPAGEEPQGHNWREGPFRVHMPVDVRSVSLSIIAGAAILGVLKLAQPVIIPFVVSGLLFYALDPAVDWLQRWKMPRVLGAALVLLIALGGIGAGGYALTDDVMSVVNGLPQGVRKLREELRRPSPQ